MNWWIFTHSPPVTVPIEMKCTSTQPPQMTIVNEHCNKLNNNSSVAGIVDGSGILAQINPSPIIQQQSNSQMTSMNISTPPEHLHKSPASTSTGSTSACGSCLQPICDRYIMKVVETPYHERCLQCVSCCCNLMNTCYQRDNKLYCRIDYERWVALHLILLPFSKRKLIDEHRQGRPKTLLTTSFNLDSRFKYINETSNPTATLWYHKICIYKKRFQLKLFFMCSTFSFFFCAVVIKRKTRSVEKEKILHLHIQTTSLVWSHNHWISPLTSSWLQLLVLPFYACKHLRINLKVFWSHRENYARRIF